LALLPVWYWGTEEQKQRVLRAATSDTSGEYLAGYAASEPPGTPGGTANFDSPLPYPVGIGVTARRDGDQYVLNGRKYWPCNVGAPAVPAADVRSEEHTSELQSQSNLVCRLLLEKKKN